MPTDDEFRSMSDTELLDWYETELRAKYNQDDRDTMAKAGEAMHDGSYPIKDEDDLKNAIRAVGRGGASHNAIRAHIIARAKALELSNLIPENWADDGSLKTARSASRSMEWRRSRADQLRSAPERRIAVECVELRADPDDGMIHFSGYASVTESPYDMGWYNETIARDAFKKTLAAKPDVVLNLGHGTNGSGLPIARTTAGNLQLHEIKGPSDARDADIPWEGKTGLHVKGQLDPLDPDVQLLKTKYNNKNLDGQMSFAFRAERQEWNDDYTERRITEANIHRGDVSIVTQGANPITTSSIRSDDALMAARHIGVIGYLEALQEIRDGKTLSGPTQEVITQGMTLYSVDEAAMEEAQPLFAELMRSPAQSHDLLSVFTRLIELRAGATISQATMTALQEVLDLIDASDTNVDKALIALSKLMGVTNPDIAQDADLDRDASDEDEDSSSENLAAEDDFEHRLQAVRLQDAQLRVQKTGVAA